MSISAISQYDLLNNVLTGSTVSSSTPSAGTSASDKATTTNGVSFEDLLNQQVSTLTDAKDLTSALSHTVLGSTVSDLSQLSDMLKSGSSQKLLSQLSDGEFSSLVMTSDEDSANSDNTLSSLLGNDTSSTDTSSSLTDTLSSLLSNTDTSSMSSSDLQSLMSTMASSILSANS